MVAIVDADSIIWAIAWIYKDATREEIVQEEIRERLRKIFDESGSTDYLITLGGEGNFRKALYDFRPYKGTRPEKPDWYLRLGPLMEETLRKEFHAVSKDRLEADDLCSMAAFGLRARRTEYIICSPDKDMKQIPGWHMNIREEELKTCEVSYEEAKRYFWYQMLVGDTGDNVEGVKGIGPKGADKILDTNNPGVWDMVVENEYIKKYGEDLGIKYYQKTFYTLLLVRPGHIEYSELDTLWLLEQIKPIQ